MARQKVKQPWQRCKMSGSGAAGAAGNEGAAVRHLLPTAEEFPSLRECVACSVTGWCSCSCRQCCTYRRQNGCMTKTSQDSQSTSAGFVWRVPASRWYQDMKKTAIASIVTVAIMAYHGHRLRGLSRRRRGTAGCREPLHIRSAQPRRSEGMEIMGGPRVSPRNVGQWCILYPSLSFVSAGLLLPGRPCPLGDQHPQHCTDLSEASA